MNQPGAIDKVAWLLVDQWRILSTRSVGKATYYIPGGKREPGESDHDCLAREIREELSVTLRLATARFVGQFTAAAHGHEDGTTIRMRCYECAYDGTLAPASEIAEMAWLTYAGREQSSPVDRVAFDWLRRSGRL